MCGRGGVKCPSLISSFTGGTGVGRYDHCLAGHDHLVFLLGLSVFPLVGRLGSGLAVYV